MKHEKAHVSQKHSYDIVFLEVLTALFWFSPLIYFYKNSIKNVHEFLADEAVLQTASTPQYGRLLLKQQQPQYAVAYANHFFSQLKKRIIMMTKNRSSKKAMLKYALFIPILITVVSFIVACAKDAKNDAIEQQVDAVPEFQGGQEAMFKFLSENIKYPKEAVDDFSEGTSYIGFVVEKDGSISNVAVKKTAQPPSVDTIQQVDPITFATQTKIIQNSGSDILDKEAMRVIQTMPKWMPAKKSEQAVRAEFVLPVTFKMEEKEVPKVNGLSKISIDTIQQMDPATGKVRQLIIVNDSQSK